VLNGQDYSANAKPLDDIKMINEAVALTLGGIGGIGRGFVDSNKVKIIKTGKINRPLGFITIGEPSKKYKGLLTPIKSRFRSTINVTLKCGC